jgi:threonine dehydrogenase-like Zn-dependent dehydrogenase
MRAVVSHGIGDIGLDEVPEPTIGHPQDGIVRLTASAISGTDLHRVRGTDQRRSGGIKVELEPEAEGEAPKPRFKLQETRPGRSR